MAEHEMNEKLFFSVAITELNKVTVEKNGAERFHQAENNFSFHIAVRFVSLTR